MRPHKVQSKGFTGDPSQNFQYRFGPFFLDATRRVLLREGQRIPLSAKSLDTLLSLVVRRGETVAKAELLTAVWGDAVVEENSLNKCISEIRKALGERRGQHDYIVTMTGVGYRFVAPVTRETAVPEKNGTAETPSAPGGASPLRIAVATAALLALAAGVYFLARGAPSQRRIAVILPLKILSASGDTAWLSTAVGEMLYHELAGRPPASLGGLRLIPPEDAAGIQRDLPARRPPAEAFDDIRKYSGAEIALAGTVTVLPGGGAGRPLRIDLSVNDLRTGDILASKSVDGSETQMFALVRRLAEEVRETLAVGAAATQTAGRRPPLPALASAMRPYAEGLAALRASDPATARDRLLEAVAADPSNALCYAALSAAWSGLGYQRNAEDAARRAFDLSASLDDLDRLAVEGRYRLTTRDWPRAAEIYEAIWKLVPDSIEYATALLEAYGASGKIDQARSLIARLRASMGADPRVDLLEARLAAFTWSDHRRIAVIAKHAAETARQRGMRDLQARALLWQARAMWSAGEGGSAPLRAEARRICEELRDSGCVAWSLRADGNQYLMEGHMIEARESYTRALAAARQNGNLDEQINELNGLGLLYWKLGDLVAADRCYREAVPLAGEAPNGAAMIHNNYSGVLAAAGHLTEARKQAESALAQARAGRQVESEADALSALAIVDRLAGNPRGAVALDREALAVAKRSEKKLAQVEIQFDLALSLADAGDTAAAAQAIQSAKSAGAGGGDCDAALTEASVAFAESRYAHAEGLAAAWAGRARISGEAFCETLAEALRARALLAQGRLADARNAAARAVSIRETPDHSLARFEAQFAEAAAAVGSSGRLAALAREAEGAGYLALAREMRSAAQHPARAVE
jgi:eukaryotic-like serine/threonine-protein kinase